MSGQKEAWTQRLSGRALLFLLLLSSAALVSGGAGACALPPAIAGGPHIQTTLHASSGESQLCASINSATTLDGTYAGIYDGLKNGTFGSSGGSGGPNTTAPTNVSAYPNLTVGESQLNQAWVGICDSVEYGQLYGTAGSVVLSGYQLNGSTGHYQVFFGISYDSGCTLANGSEGSCSFITQWYVDLVTGSVSGPFTTASGPPLGTPTSSASGGGLRSIDLTPIEYSILVSTLVALAGTLLVIARARAGRGRGGKNPIGDSPILQAQVPSAAPTAVDSGDAQPAPREFDRNGSFPRQSEHRLPREDGAEPLEDVY
jgi:hypothetical protein